MPLLIFLALLPALLSLGVAAQAAGVYLAGLLPLSYFFFKSELGWRHRAVLRSVGLALFALWVVFPLSNFANSVLPLGTTVADLPWPVDVPCKKLFESRLSSAFLISAVVALLPSFAGRKRSESSAGGGNLSPERALWWFFAGLFAATCLLGGYLALQTVTGFDPRSPGHVLAVEHQTLGGFYRVFGFYGHPLSVAGVSLLWLSLSWALLWNWISQYSRGNLNYLRQFCETSRPRSYLCYPLFLVMISVFHFAFIVLSGGRTALLVAVVALASLPNLVILQGRVRLLRRTFLLAAFPTVALLAWMGGFLNRFSILADKIQAGSIADDRLLFWKTHLTIFSEKMWLGQGHYWLENVIRKEYYARLGFERLAERKNFNAHNLYIETLADVGILGSGLLLLTIFLSWRFLREEVRALPTSRVFGGALLVAVMANLLHGLTENTYFVSNIALPYLATLWVFLWVTLLDTSKPPSR